jgi:hypothetical protein
VVSPFGQDGFALLKADKIFESLGTTAELAAKGQVVKGNVEKVPRQRTAA